MKRQIIPIFIIIAFLITGCAGLQLKPAEEGAIFHTLGYQAAYWPLYDHPERIELVEPSLDMALALIAHESVDIASLIDEIIGFMGEMGTIEGFKVYAPAFNQAVRSLNGLLLVDIQYPDEYQDAVNRTRAFLEGARDAIRDIKGGLT